MEQLKNKTPFIESLPSDLAAKLDAAKGPGEDVLIQVATDMADQERFDSCWLVVTGENLLVLQAGRANSTLKVPLDTIKTARVEPLVGGGRLELEHKTTAPTHLYYSSSLSAKFAEVAEGIAQLVDGQDMTLPTELERNRCAKCNRLLPEKDGICPACIKKWDSFKRLISYMAPYKFRAMIMLSLTAAMTALDLVPPLITKIIIDDVLAPPLGAPIATDAERLTHLSWLVAALLGVSLLTLGSTILRRYLNVWVGCRAMQDMRDQLYRALQYLPLHFYNKRKVGAVISRMNKDAELVEDYLIFDIPFVISNGLTVIGILAILLYYNWALTVYVLLPVPPIVLASSLIWDRMGKYWRRWSAKWSRLQAQLNESIRGIRVVKAFAQEKRESQRFDQRNIELRHSAIAAERSWWVFFLVSNFIMGLGVFMVWYFGGRQIIGGLLTLGGLMLFITYIWKLYQPLKWFSDFYNFMVRAFAGAERVFEVIDARSEPFDDPKAQPMPQLKGHVGFENAFFGYDPGKPVLKGVNLQVKAGEMIGLVGKSGVGKSTLITLVSRFYDAQRGAVTIDGVDIRKIRLEDLRSQIGIVPQQNFLFNGTIANNISYGKPDASFEAILRAARAANAHEFIVTKPDGYDMIVGEQGSRLSGGEKQRIAIARAILHDPKILILDEATSSLDTPTEKKIQEAIARLVKGRTTFAIAHRLSTLRSADRLVVVDEGKVAEVGTHAQLMERQGLFYSLVKTQQETSSVMTVSL